MEKFFCPSVLLLSLAIAACTPGRNGAENGAGDRRAATASAAMAAPDTPMVATAIASVGDFNLTLISNGKISSAEAADLYFSTTGKIVQLWVKNGQRVTKGQPLARLDTSGAEISAKRYQSEIEKAKISMANIIINQGFDPSHPEDIPEKIIRLSRIQSGLDIAENALEETRNHIDAMTLYAPFSGTVANINAEKHSMASLSEPFCRLINDAMMEVEFPVLETELSLIGIGSTVEVTPFSSGNSWQATVTEINPVVDENGQITVKASLKGNGLIDGMNVSVTARSILTRALSVPKSAVVNRNGRTVVFSLKNGRSRWNYVTTGTENKDSVIIKTGINANDTVIVTGNETLVDNLPVKLPES